MTQPEGAPQGTEAAPLPGPETPPAAPPAPEPSISDLLIEGFRADAPAASAPPSGTDDTPDTLKPPAAEIPPATPPAPPQQPPAPARQDPPAPESPQGAAKPDPVVDRWADELVEKPQRINEVPMAHRSTVLARFKEKIAEGTVKAVEKSVQDWAAQAIDAARQEGWQAAQNEFLHATDYAQVEAMRKDNPAAFADLPASDPELYGRYTAYGERTRQREQQQAQAPTLQAQRELFQRSAQPTVALLRANPRAAALIQARAQANPGIYDFTPEGVANFIGDAGQALAQAVSEARQEDPSVLAAEERRRAAQERGERGLPVPPATNGHAPGPADSGSFQDLIKQGWREDLLTKR